MSKLFVTLGVIAVACLLAVAICASANESAKRLKDDVMKNRKLPKNIMFASDMDLEHLYDQWDEPDEDDEPSTKETMLTADMVQKETTENLMAMSKKGKTVMAFVTVANNPTKEQTEILTQRWQVGLSNNHIKSERFLISDDRAIFVFQDGSLAFEAKDFLLSQPELKEYAIDNKTWQGKGYPVEYPNQPRTDL